MHNASTCELHPGWKHGTVRQVKRPTPTRPLAARSGRRLAFRAMSDPARLELSAMGAVRPPAEAAVAAAARREAQGFDAVWWADHFLHWFPYSIWTPDLVPQAAAGQ